jgi:hypothetical protein
VVLRAATKGGGCEIFPSLLPTHHPRSQSSQNKNTTEPKATKQQEENMPSDRATAIREVQADILSTLKKASYFTNDTTRAHINSLHLDDFNRLKSIAKWRKITCERAIKACIDGQQLAPRKTEYKYHYRLFADYLEILQIELDRIIEIQEYMEDQEDMIKFKTDQAYPQMPNPATCRTQRQQQKQAHLHRCGRSRRGHPPGILP